jgi:hypothetical protein
MDLIWAKDPDSNLLAKELLSTTKLIFPASSLTCAPVDVLDPSKTISVPSALSFFVLISKDFSIASLLWNPIPTLGSSLLPVWLNLIMGTPLSFIDPEVDNTISSSPRAPSEVASVVLVLNVAKAPDDIEL